MNKEKFQEELLKDIEKSLNDGTDTMLAIHDRFKDIAKDYDNCDPELQKMFDTHMSTMTIIAKNNVSKMEDGIIKREATRRIRKMEGKHFDFDVLYSTLKEQKEENDDLFKNANSIIYEQMQMLLDLMSDVVYNGSKIKFPEALKLSLYYYSIEELTLAKYLLDHNYVNQAYTHLRSVYETVDLIDLFEKDSKYIELWSNDSNDEKIEKEKRETFKPSNVRRELNRKNSIYENIYWLLCEIGTHTTYKNIKSRVSLKIKGKDFENSEFSLKLGGIPFKGDKLFGTTMLIQTISFVFISITKNYNDFFSDEEVEKMIDKLKDGTVRFYSESVVKELREMGFNVDKMVDFLAKNS